jgi:hypothetical protein
LGKFDNDGSARAGGVKSGQLYRTTITNDAGEPQNAVQYLE